MTIVFHLEKFASHGKNKTLLTISSIYLLTVALIAGSIALLKFKTVKISKAFDVRFRENRIKLMKAETLHKSKRLSSNNKSSLATSVLEKKQSINLDKKFKRRGERRKTNLNMMMKMAI